MNSTTIDATEASFDDLVLRHDTPVLVDFWATWCVPCKQVAPHLEAIAQEYEGRLRVVKVDIEECPALTKQYNVQSVPSLILIKHGAEVGRLRNLSMTRLCAAIDETL